MPPKYARVMAALGVVGFLLIDPSLSDRYLNRGLSILLGTIALIAGFVVAIAGSISDRRERSKKREDK